MHHHAAAASAAKATTAAVAAVAVMFACPSGPYGCDKGLAHGRCAELTSQQPHAYQLLAAIAHEMGTPSKLMTFMHVSFMQDRSCCSIRGHNDGMDLLQMQMLT